MNMVLVMLGGLGCLQLGQNCWDCAEISWNRCHISSWLSDVEPLVGCSSCGTCMASLLRTVQLMWVSELCDSYSFCFMDYVQFWESVLRWGMAGRKGVVWENYTLLELSSFHTLLSVYLVKNLSTKLLCTKHSARHCGDTELQRHKPISQGADSINRETEAWILIVASGSTL